MKDFVSRRSMLQSIGYTATYGSIAQLISVARAADATAPAAAPAATPDLALSMMFMNGPKTKLDIKKYTTKHLPLLRKLYGDAVSRIEFRIANPTAKGVPSDVKATTTIYIANLAAFIPKLSAAAAEVKKDLDEISTGAGNVQVDSLLFTSGDARSEVRENHQVFSTFYRDKPDANFDRKYYTEVYLPKLRSYYGDSSIRRIEVYVGQPQGGAKPYFVASTHLFIRERSAFDNANRDADAELMKTDVKYTNTDQMWADLKVSTIA